jgi:hypothetical protein
MEERSQKSKILSYTAKYKLVVVHCTEENGNCKATELFGVDESSIGL